MGRLSEVADLAAANKPILVLDIECSPITAHVWDVWGKVGGPSKIVEPQRVMCFAAKWVGRGEVLFSSEHHHGRDAMVKAAWDLIDRAWAIVTYNGARYDLPHLRREFLLAGLPPARPHHDIDLYRTVKRRFKWESNSLDYVSRRLGLGGKHPHDGLETWRRCMDGDAEAWEQFKRYNVEDVRLTERLYHRLLPHITPHPHVRTDAAGEVACPRCGSGDVERTSNREAVVLAYAMYRCQTCSGLFSPTHSVSRFATTRPVA